MKSTIENVSLNLDGKMVSIKIKSGYNVSNMRIIQILNQLSNGNVSKLVGDEYNVVNEIYEKLAERFQ